MAYCGASCYFLLFLLASFQGQAFSRITKDSAEAYQFIVMRHARAPGIGDPPGFQLSDCRTQRNLSKEGVLQAKRIGRGLPKEISVYSSQWCRAMDAARILGLGEVKELPLLNSFFDDRSREKEATEALRHWIEGELGKMRPFILVTHQVNITALTGLFPEEGELLFLRVGDGDRFEIVKREKP